ncbi:DNA-processing protein DprA [Chitinophaga sp. CF418]|uniref:DNA-processing protein DprA n=1 Tax=Chitinophaga sp. CF418 TaxID=1855287 RepID=UPI00091ECED9|nr:DNA-processing protein DprA [Chitinophaga sp. CF418]SHM06838.1 DNA processing protein [Chitinophaga sp. CF418]
MQEELRHQMALTQIPQIGDIVAKKLLAHFHSASAVFAASKHELENIPDIGAVRAAAILQFCDYEQVDREIEYIEQHDIQPVFYTSAQYPQRLKHCADSPVMLYYKGNADLNAGKIVSIVGTRAPGDYGKAICASLVEDLAEHNVIVVSGMAYGIDIIAHRQALLHGIPTIGVLAHGLDRIYPPQHKGTAMAMVENGGLLTEFLSETQPDKQHFPMRNRIVAGIADATVVVESGLKGGSLITADIANSYNKDVFAIPGRIGDPHAAGCNELIKTNRAMLITGAADLLQVMGWDHNRPSKMQPASQRELFVTLDEAEQHILTLFTGKDEKHIDQLRRESYLPGSQVTSLVLKLEMQHVLKGLPGQKYQVIN